MDTRWVIGLASGSSADGADAALVEVTGAGLDMRTRLVESLHDPYPDELRDLIRSLAGGSSDGVEQVSLLHRLLGETFATAARSVADKASLSLAKVQVVGCPGHTIWHQPEGRFPHTLGLGMASVVAERLGITTVSDFRSRDVAVGGQGVPLAALTDHLLFRSFHENRILLHLGGLARLVYLPASRSPGQVLGFEAGPCNILLDALMRRLSSGKRDFDTGGRHAVQGSCVEPILQTWLADPYLKRRPPKSVPRHLFGDAFANEAEAHLERDGVTPLDLLCTATHFVARCITDAVTAYLPSPATIDRILVSGGGTRNGLLWHLLEQQLEGQTLCRTEEVGISAQFRKAHSFGILAALTLDGVPGNVPAATGAEDCRLLGSITPGSPMNWARCISWMAQHTRAPLGNDVD